MTPAPRKRILVRSGALAAAVAASVSGGAYAAVESTGNESLPLPSLTGGDIAQAAEAPTAEPDSTPAIGGDVPEAESAAAGADNVVVEDVTEAHGSTEEETDQLPKGEKKVKTAGVDGMTRVTYRVTSADGVEVSREAVSSVVVTAKVDEVTIVGTKEAAAAPSAAPTASSGADTSSGSSTSAAAPADDGSLDDDFQRLAQCESGGNPRAVNPAGYYGLYQFSLDTWASVGGTGNPIDASPEEQTMRAKMLQQRSGWSQWGCGH